MSSPNRRHAPSRAAAQRRWEDVSEWPFQFVILPVLVGFAFFLVLFLGSKHGTRLAAFRTWFPTNVPCNGAHCVSAIAVDREGGLAGRAGLSSVAPANGVALSGFNGRLRQHNARAGATGAADDFGVVALAREDLLKYDFDHWLAEAEKVAGQQPKDCDASYGLQYLEKWRKARVDWCTASDGTAATAAAAAGLAAAGGAGGAQARGGGGRRLRDAGGNKTTTTASISAGKQSPKSAAAAAQSRGGNVSSSSGSTASATNVSSITLYPFHDKEAYLMFAAATNTVLDSRSFLGSLPGGMPEARPGSFAAACRLDTRASPGEEFMSADAVRRWTRDALQARQYDKISAACAPKAVNASAGSPGPLEHPVLLLSRLDPTNAFRTVEEVVSAFTALAVLRDPRVAKQGIQVVLADGRPDGAYLDLWAAVSQPYPLRLLSQQPWPPNTCLSNVVLSTHGAASILTSMGVAHRTTCRSSVVIAASLWLRHLMGPAVQPPLRSVFGSQVQNKGVVRKSVVWISRRNFEGQAQANLTPWQDQRRFDNEGEVVLELQREIWRWNDEACIRSGLTKSFGTGRRLQQLRRLAAALHLNPDLDPHAATASAAARTSEDLSHAPGTGAEPGGLFSEGSGGPRVDQRRQLHGSGGGGGSRCRSSNVFFDLRVVELNDMPFYPDHVQVLGQATVLAGAHGSGLASMIWMAPGKGGVLELHHNSAGNDHYHNQAHLLGHKYVNVDSDGDRVDLVAAAEGMRKLLDALGA